VIAGVVDAEGTPTITLRVGGADWRAVIDTGFNGDLELPDALLPVLAAQFVGQSHSELAAGQFIVEDLYLVDFPFDGQLLRAEATFVPGGEILIGTHLLANHCLTVHFPNRSVLIESA